MKIIPIFVEEKTYQGLYSICYKGSKSEYDVVFNLWNDVSYIRKFCKENLHFFKNGFYGNITLEEAINQIRQEVLEITEIINSTKNWESIFEPLNVNECSPPEHSKRKIKLSNNRFRKSKLRLYAIRLTENTFVITGGAIKVTYKMKEHKDTNKELEKIERVRDWLREDGIYNEDDLIYYYEEK